MDPFNLGPLFMQNTFVPAQYIPDRGVASGRSQEIQRGGGDWYVNNQIGYQLQGIPQHARRFKGATGTPVYSTTARTPQTLYHGENIGNRQ